MDAVGLSSKSQVQKDGDVPRIQKLEPDVVNRIAAGEVVQRPANAVKELIENSLDAGSRAIVITVNQGGLKLLQIQDDGHGIRVEDFGVLCERFTTSKLRQYEDLKSISSFGFRGEALASITHVAHVTIMSKTRQSPCAYKARYSDGRLMPLKPSDKDAKPQPCAGTNGTLITVEDLFYNMQTRRAAFKNPNDQYRAILDVVTRYAIHFGSRGISFTCKKHGQAGADLHTPKGGTVLGNIKIAFGQVVARELLELQCSSSEGEEEGEGESNKMEVDESGPESSGKFHFKATGYISNANYNMKKSVFMLFINHRLVESTAIKKTIDSIYAPILPNNTHPFVYLSIEMPASHLDVNVHPTKREVQFLFEDCLLEKLATAVSVCLEGANTSRTFYGKSLARGLPPLTDSPVIIGAAAASEAGGDGGGKGSSSTSGSGAALSKAPAAAPIKYAHHMVRTDASMGSMRSFLYTGDSSTKASGGGSGKDDGKASSATSTRGKRVTGDAEGDGMALSGSASDDVEDGDQESTTGSQAEDARLTPTHKRFRRKLPTLTETSCTYDSVRTLIADIKDRVHQGLVGILKRHTFVGVVDMTYSLIQHDTKLLLVRHVDLARELFYQMAIRRFAVLPRLSLELNPFPIREALQTVLDMPSVQWQEHFGPKEELAMNGVKLLVEKAPMLDEYFRIGITADGQLDCLPDLVSGYTPSPEAIPLFLLRLATEVDWQDEQACFDGIATELSLFYADFCAYSEESPDVSLDDQQQLQSQPATEEAETGPVPVKYERLLQDIIYPAFRSIFLPPREFSDSTITQIASLEKLYKVFERC